MADHTFIVNHIWQIADLLRGTYLASQYERVILPMTLLRRLECVLEPTKIKVLDELRECGKSELEREARDRRLNKAAGQRYHNHSPLDLRRLLEETPYHVSEHLFHYIGGFSENVRNIFWFFEFDNEIEKMREANVLYLVVSQFVDVDLHPDRVSDKEMGLIFENLLLRFNVFPNRTAVEHFTPRDVVRMMASVLFANDQELLTTPGTVRKLLDPVCGTGGMLVAAQDYLREHHPTAKLSVFGQENDRRAFATAASFMLLRNEDSDNVRLGDVFKEDQFDEPPHERFDYLLANPPFGLSWKRQQPWIQSVGDDRFVAGLPRISDASLLFLQHMISKFEPIRPEEHKHGSRLAILLSGSPLFAGSAGSGESEIRRWILENDWLEAVIALPEEMFYNTSIGTYVWIVTNRKERKRKGKVQLVDARELYVPMHRNLGQKRRKLGEQEDGVDQIAMIVRLYERFEKGHRCKIFDNEDFGFTRVTVERPLRLRYQMTAEDKARFIDACPHLLGDVQAIEMVFGKKPRLDWNDTWEHVEQRLRKRSSRWKKSEEKLFRRVFTVTDPAAEPVKTSGRGQGYEPDVRLRNFEIVPLKVDVNTYFTQEVQPHVPDAWMDRARDQVGYQINFNRHFYTYSPPRPMAESGADLRHAEDQLFQLLHEARKRRALVAQAVTQGLAAGVELRDSGIPWVGSIPAHWTATRLKFVAEIQGGLTLGKRYDSEYLVEYPYLRAANVQDGYLNLDEVSTAEVSERDAASCRIQPGDVLMNAGGDAGKLGRGCIWRGEIDPCLHQNHVFAVRPVGVTSEWLNLWKSTEGARAFFESQANRMVSLASISATTLKELPIPLPPEDEQIQIASHVESEARDLGLMEQAIRQTMEHWREWRDAEIEAAVNGQLDFG